MKILAIDRDLEHYLRIIITEDEYCTSHEYFNLATEKMSVLVSRYNLNPKEPDDDLLNEHLFSAGVRNSCLTNPVN